MHLGNARNIPMKRKTHKHGYMCVVTMFGSRDCERLRLLSTGTLPLQSHQNTFQISVQLRRRKKKAVKWRSERCWIQILVKDDGFRNNHASGDNVMRRIDGCTIDVIYQISSC